MTRFSFAAISAALLLAAPAASQSFAQGISLSGLGNGGPGKSFGISHEPTQGLIYVAVSGDFLTPNNVVAVIDPTTNLVIDTIACGLFPQDIAFHYDAQGNLLHGMVSDSTSGTLTIWDASRTPVATVALPDPFGWGTCYPFGIEVVGNLAYVTTFDGSGDVHAVDLNSLALSSSDSLHSPGRSFGRPLAVGAELWLPGTQYTPSFTGAYGGLERLPMSGATGESWVAEASDGLFVFPAGQDLVRLADGRSFLGGTSFGDRLWILDAVGNPARAIQIGTTGVQGLALSPNEDLIVAVDNAAERLAFIDPTDEEVDLTLGVGAWGNQPNDAVFAQGRLYVSCQGSEEVLVFDNLPQPSAGTVFRGSLSVSDTTPTGGASVQVNLTGFPGLPVALYGSATLGSSSIAGAQLVLPSPPRLLATGTGTLSVSFTVPARWGLGTQVHLQGVVDHGGALLDATRPVSAVIQ